MIAASTSRNIDLYAASIACAFLENCPVPRVSHWQRRNQNDAEIDAARPHHFVAEMRNKRFEHSRMCNDHHTLAGLDRELPDDAAPDGRMVERKPRLLGP